MSLIRTVYTFNNTTFSTCHYHYPLNYQLISLLPIVDELLDKHVYRLTSNCSPCILHQLEFLPGQAVNAAWWMNGIGTLIVVKEVCYVS